MFKKTQNTTNLMSGQFLLLIIFVVYIVFNVQTPQPLASMIDSTFGYVVIIALFAVLAINLNPIVIVVGVFAIYLLSVVLTSTSINFGGGYIIDSKFYTYANSYLPNVITDLKVKAEELLNQVT